KSTFAKIIDVLEVPDSGSVVVLGHSTSDKDHFWDIRENCACVFQNPDNQIVGTTVEEDVAFGPENLGVPLPELRTVVDDSLKAVGLYDLSKKMTAELSGGQKQKLAIAGALAMKPKVLILDEATAMLDPMSREEFLLTVERLRLERGMTVITITHDMTEAQRCEKVFVIEDGVVTLSGTPEEVFADKEMVMKSGLELPVNCDLVSAVSSLTGSSVSPSDLKDDPSCSSAVCRMLKDVSSSVKVPAVSSSVRPSSGKTVMEVSSLSYSYDNGQTFAINNMDLDVYEGEILGIVGKSGCGKTTLITHLNGLMRPQSGDVRLFSEGKTFSTKNRKQLKDIREKVGLVFQYPEYQLFEETVYKDIAYGLRKTSLSDEEKKERVISALKIVGLSSDLLEMSPFELSGGQKRRVAIAGVLVMRPKILVLDEPASGLDPRGKREMTAFIQNLRDRGCTIIIVSHNMDEAARICDRICCIRDGRIMAVKTPGELFSDASFTSETGILRPLLYDFSDRVKAELAGSLPGIVFEDTKNNVSDEAASIVSCVLRHKGGGHER
ncbi:MAG: ATP-binding cassette domain-containing protein, partial [Clostridiales bacterium]|nr:ATP-binding cassette domain-containing protein [Clostridiales bacterium]